MILSATSIKQFKACRRAYELRKVYGVKPVETADALKTGLTYHGFIERYYETGELPQIVDRETAMVNAFVKYISPDLPKYEPEVKISKSVGYGNVLEGRLDGFISCDNPVIVEHKTTSLSTDEYIYNLQWDEQTKAYCLATGARTVLYTICRKPTIRQKQSETEADFGERCFEWYDEDTESKIKVIRLTFTDDEINQYKKELRKMFKEVKSGHFYRNTCNCMAWGRKCEYAPICLEYDPTQEYVGFIKRGEDNADNECKG